MSIPSTGLSKHEKPAELGARGARAPPRDPLTVTIREAMRLTGLGRSTIYKLIGAKKLKLRKIGTRTLIIFESLRELIEDTEADTAA
jgi:excisionase family DNA binding protein